MADGTVTLADAIREASGLDAVAIGVHPEYTRGISELIARLFPVEAVCTDERAEEIIEQLRGISNV